MASSPACPSGGTTTREGRKWAVTKPVEPSPGIVEAVARSGRDPGYEAGVSAAPAAQTSLEATSAEEADKELDKLARDQIERRITSAFAGHDFTELIGAILTAQG